MDVKALVGKRIKSLRQARKTTQEALAEKMGISAKYLSSIERGQENPTLDTLIKLADALKVELEEIFTISHEVSDPKSLRKSLDHLLKEADQEKLQIAVKLLKATFH